ncbi:MAG: hypothetical protein HC819_06195 [Cyclobacteriaceae bacterium]|nr:hypothetical protein [Cyclobacteriaceae bacterium]
MKKSINEYYDLNGLIDRQIVLLDSISPVLFKKANINGQIELSQLAPNDSIWDRELVIFRSGDINKPMLAGRYALEQTKAEDGSNIHLYRSLNPKKTEVDSLSVQYFSGTSKPSHIRAVIRTSNPLFSNEKKLELHFDHESELLRAFAISGWQKMISKNRATYHIEGEMKP